MNVPPLCIGLSIHTPYKYIFEEVTVPNGASIRPNTSVMQKLARTVKNPHVCIYCIVNGTGLPEDLILVHEFRDHYSLQARRGMGVDGMPSLWSLGWVGFGRWG